jgi:hypothetical protein
MHGNEYWGIGGTSYCKNMVYDGCMLSRFDAHAGVYNGKILNSTINAIEIIGGGEMLIENTEFVLSRPLLIDLRTDYGSTWCGDVTIRNCTVKNFKPENTSILRGTWVNGNYGYTAHIPSVTVDNLVFDNVEKVKIMDVQVPRAIPEYKGYSLQNEILENGVKNENPYIPPKFVKIMNNNEGYVYYLPNVPHFKDVVLDGCVLLDE